MDRKILLELRAAGACVMVLISAILGMAILWSYLYAITRLEDSGKPKGIIMRPHGAPNFKPLAGGKHGMGWSRL